MGRKNLSKIRQKEIIISFYNVAKKIGLENTSIAKVADVMNISKGLVMHYFKTKDDILKALNEFILERHINVLLENNYGKVDTYDKLNLFIEDLFSRKWNTYFDDSVFYSFYALIYRNEDINTDFKKYLESIHDVLRLKLCEAKNNGVIFNENIDEITEIIFALIDGAYYYLGTFKLDGEDYKKQVNIYIKYTMKLLTS